MVEVEITLTKIQHLFVERLVVTFEHIAPEEPTAQVVEDESRTQTVLARRQQQRYLSGGTGQHDGQPGVVDVDALLLLAAVIADGLMVERLAESVAVIAVVRLQGLRHGVGLRLHNHPPASIVRKSLIGSRSRRIGGYEHRSIGRFLGFGSGSAPRLVQSSIFSHLLLIFILCLLVQFFQFALDGHQ